MKHISPIFAALLTLLSPQFMAAQAPPAQAEQSLVQRAAAVVEGSSSVALQMRQHIRLFGHQLVATGSYQQLGAGPERRMRLDMKTKVAGQTASVQQVCDGRFLWIRREVGDSGQLGRVDLRRIQQELTDLEYGGTSLDATTQWIVLGGLPQLIARLDQNFQFGTPQRAQLDGAAVVVVEGVWKPQKLAELLPAQRETIESGQPLAASLLPEQLPAVVRFVAREKDAFPVRIEYLRPAAPTTPEGAPSLESIVGMELFDIRLSEAIDPLTFVYKPGNQEVADHTEVYLKSLAPKPQRQAALPPEPAPQ